MKSLKEKKEMEYPDAPSGYVTLYNYKEPFMRFDTGYGYQGVLLFDGDEDTVQCHFCGEWFHALGNHLHKEHNMDSATYKQLVGLNKTTALIGEKMREKLIAKNLGKRLKNLRPGRKHTEATKEKIRATLKENRREMQNITGTCPEQLLERLRKVYEEKGAAFSLRRVSFGETLIRVFGSMQAACTLANVPYRQPGQTVTSQLTFDHNKIEEVNWVKKFIDENNRLPTYTDYDNAGKKSRYEWMRKKGMRDQIFKEASLLGKPVLRMHYTKDELLTFIGRFIKVHGRDPSVSDCRRKLLPGHARYYYHFGNLAEAVKQYHEKEKSKSTNSLNR